MVRQKFPIASMWPPVQVLLSKAIGTMHLALLHFGIHNMEAETGVTGS